MLKLYYITLNTPDEAKMISRELLTEQHAVCTNWFPITCAYRWEGEIKEEPEVVLIVKSKENKFSAIEAVVKKHIQYTNCITEIDTIRTNQSFCEWLSDQVI